MAIAQVGTFKKITGPNGGTSSSMDTTGATLLVCGIGAPGGSVFTISDSKGNTWHLADTVNSQSEEVWYCWNPTVGSGHTFTVTGTSIFCLAYFTAWSGVKTSADPLDQHVTETGTGHTDPANPGSITPTEDGELCYLTWKDLGCSTVTGYTVIDTDAGAGGDHVGGGNAFNVQTTATATNPNMNGVSTGFGDIVFVSFKATSGPSTIITGAITKQTNKALTVGITPAGQVDALVNYPLTGSITPAGAVAKLLSRTLTGSITPAGALTTNKTHSVTLTGSITPAGQVDALVIYPLTGSITPAGQVDALVIYPLTGTIAPTGALTPTKIPGAVTYTLALSGRS